MESLKLADRRKTYLKTSPDSVSILSAREKVPITHRMEVESRAPSYILQVDVYLLSLIYINKIAAAMKPPTRRGGQKLPQVTDLSNYSLTTNIVNENEVGIAGGLVLRGMFSFLFFLLLQLATGS